MAWKIFLVICLTDFVLSEKEAISEQRVVIHHLKSEEKINPSESEGKKSEEYAWSYPSYEFSYKVKDPETHDEKGQHEKREGDEVKGLYWLIEPDGVKRTVNYEANDKKGFNADVEYSNNESEKKIVRHNYEVVEIIENDEEPRRDNVQQRNNAENEQQSNNDENNNENNEQSNINENNQNNNNGNSQGGENAENNNNNNNEADISNQNENNEQSQNNNNNNINERQEEKNELSDNSGNESQLEASGKIRRDYKGYNTNNNRIKEPLHGTIIKVNIGRNDEYDINENIRNHDKLRNQDNIREHRNTGNKQKKSNQKQAIRIIPNIKHTENNRNSNIKPKNSHKPQKAPENIEENRNDKNELNENKSVKYEHRIRVHHPKILPAKSNENLKKH